ncbi:MAG TPA: protein translocase subunit SecF [Candidatus Dormibacteraeota bacterium]|nr:protein translocase subunit SecF [Candidatus Dormibacteraeota bacterium]
MSELSDVDQEEQAADIVAEESTQPITEPEPEAKPAQVREPRIRRINIIGRRNWFFALSLLIIIPGILSMWSRGFLLGIDFAGGTEFTVTFDNNPSLAQIQTAVDAQNFNGSVIQTSGGGYIIRYPPLNASSQTYIQDDLRNRLGPMKVQQILEVGGTIAGETILTSLLAVSIAAIVILGLLAIWFRNVPGGWRAGFQFGGSALLALLHDVFVLTGIFSILGMVFKLRVGEIDAFFVTAVLTVVGFSVHDTIVVFDRIRENLRVSQRLSFEQVVNLSIMQTAARSIITSFTVVLVLAAIFISGGETLKGLSLALLIGIVSGTYSSIFNAAPLLVVWRRLQPLR